MLGDFLWDILRHLIPLHLVFNLDDYVYGDNNIRQLVLLLLRKNMSHCYHKSYIQHRSRYASSSTTKATVRDPNLQLLTTLYCSRLPYFLLTGSAPRTQPIPLTKPPVIILLTISLFLTRPSLSGDSGRASSRGGSDAELSAALLSGKAFLCSAKAAPRATSNRPIGASWRREFGTAARARRAARCCSVSKASRSESDGPNPPGTDVSVSPFLSQRSSSCCSRARSEVSSSSQRRQAPRISGSGSGDGTRTRARERSSIRWERCEIWDWRVGGGWVGVVAR